MLDILEASDVSTSATDFQADGTAAPGSTGRVADAGHVHPAAATGSLSYQITSEALIASVYNSGLYYVPTADFTVTAPTGYVIIGAFYTQTAGTPTVLPLVPASYASDGTSWTVQPAGGMTNGWGGTGTAQIGTLNAICISV